MTGIKLLVVLFAGTFWVCRGLEMPEKPIPSKVINKEIPAEAGKPIAVVELFTSQGCSSCPAADKQLAKLVKTNDTSGKNIYALSFHVSYWNYLGWKDPFSRSEFTERQKQYSRTLRTSLYTPQMVFNGKLECVGSNGLQLEAHLKKALESQPANKVDVSTTTLEDDGSVTIAFNLWGPTAKKVLNVALVERMIQVEVGRGENKGRTLHHDNVVREFKTLSVETQPSGHTQISLPHDLQMDRSSVIAYVQDTQTLEITGACQVAL